MSEVGRYHRHRWHAGNVDVALRAKSKVHVAEVVAVGVGGLTGDLATEIEAVVAIGVEGHFLVAELVDSFHHAGCLVEGDLDRVRSGDVVDLDAESGSL